jgi:hypothetical protein
MAGKVVRIGAGAENLEPYPAAIAQKHVREAMLRGNLAFSRHARAEMAKDKLLAPDMLNVLRAGWCVSSELENGTYRYRFKTNRIVVMVAFRGKQHAVVVTTWRIA